MKLEVKIFGETVVANKFERMAKDAKNATPVFKEISKYLMQITETQFESQGRRGGGSWKHNTPKWTKRKIVKGWNPLILHQMHPRSGSLRRSVTRPRTKGQVLVITNTSINFGSSLPYAGRHQYGYGKTPARPFLKVTKGDSKKITQMLSDHLMQAWARSPK